MDGFYKRSNHLLIATLYCQVQGRLVFLVLVQASKFKCFMMNFHMLDEILNCVKPSSPGSQMKRIITQEIFPGD
uniref:Uncharacterized protein n=1 Tax=Populus trichocarpa TaxID=3694 RepID=A0A2K1WXJ1_POPTR